MSTALNTATQSVKVSILRHRRVSQTSNLALYWWRNQSSLIYFTIARHLLRDASHRQRGLCGQIQCSLRVTLKPDQKISRLFINISSQDIFTVKYGLLSPNSFSS